MPASIFVTAACARSKTRGMGGERDTERAGSRRDVVATPPKRFWVR